MSRQYFGTDGIRGRTNQWPMTAELAMKVGMAAGAHFQRGSHRHRVVIGKDTRLSGYMLENALTAGLTSTGMNVLLLGPVPTPAVGYLTRSMRADVGIMISASHNPAEDNGIKFIGPTPSTLDLTGDKAAAVSAAKEAGLPTLQDSEPSTDVDKLAEYAKDFEFPVFVKAVAGGGGHARNHARPVSPLSPAASKCGVCI